MAVTRRELTISTVGIDERIIPLIEVQLTKLFSALGPLAPTLLIEATTLDQLSQLDEDSLPWAVLYEKEVLSFAQRDFISECFIAFAYPSLKAHELSALDLAQQIFALAQEQLLHNGSILSKKKPS